MVCVSILENAAALINRYSNIVSSAEQIQKAIGDVVKDFGKIDVFVANAGENRNHMG